MTALPGGSSPPSSTRSAAGPPGSGPPGSGLGEAVRQVVRLVVPLDCAGCAVPDHVLCPACAALLDGPGQRVEQQAPRLRRHGPDSDAARWPVLAAATCTGGVRELVVGWKDRGRRDLDPVLRAVMTDLAHDAVDLAHDATGLDADAGRRRRTAGTAEPSRRPGSRRARAPAVLWVVPAPSSPAARRRRGAEPVVDLAGAVAAALGRTRTGVVLVRAVRHRGTRVRDQAGLGARDRGANLAGAFTVSRRAARRARCSRPDVVLVDDVLTTGATFAECERALAAVGLRVRCGLVLAATPPPGSRAR